MKPPSLPRLGVLAALLLASSTLAASNVGRRFPSEKRVYNDKVTGLEVVALTTDPANDSKIYQTHAQWTADGKWIVFRSNRGAPAPQPPPEPAPAATTPAAGRGTAGGGSPGAAFAVNEATGEIVQLTEYGGYSGMLNLARKSMKLYFQRSASRGAPVQIVELNLERLLADSTAGKLQPPAAYERVCGTLPAGLRESGGFGLDANETHAYLGVREGDTGRHLPPGTALVQTVEGQRMGAGPAGLRSLDLATGEVKVILDTPFLMGHVQTNPWVPGEILYCHETGGDAPQRMWTVMADGTKNRPLYVETPLDWVTHEAFITKDEVIFNVLGHQSRLRTKASGIAVINLRNDHMKIYGQVEDSPPGGRGTGGYWHSNGSADGRWLVGDTFAGNLWLIERRTGTQTLLTTDHKMQPDHAHPTFSDDSRRIVFQSGHLSEGRSLDLMVIAVPDEARLAAIARRR